MSFKVVFLIAFDALASAISIWSAVAGVTDDSEFISTANDYLKARGSSYFRGYPSKYNETTKMLYLGQFGYNYPKNITQEERKKHGEKPTRSLW